MTASNVIESVPLTGAHVELLPLAEVHREALRPAAQDARIWEYTVMIGTGAGFDRWFDTTLTERASGHKYPFVVRLRATGEFVGSTSFLDVNLRHRRLEIGATWYHPRVWGTAVNADCKNLLLQDAFARLAMNRVALLTDRLNLRSQAAIAKLGATREGVMRAHMVTQGERIRDSALYSITRAEWPEIAANLTLRIATAIPTD